jgi:hypothetical protein
MMPDIDLHDIREIINAAAVLLGGALLLAAVCYGFRPTNRSPL